MVKKTWLMVGFALIGGYALPQIALQEPSRLPRPERSRRAAQVRQTVKGHKARPPHTQGRRCC